MKKKFLFSIIFIANMIFAQNFNWDNALLQIYTPQPGFAPQKVLLDKAPMFADLYNFNYPEHNISNNGHFQQALSELYTASGNNYFSDGSNIPDFENTVTTTTEIPIGIISTQCAYLNYDEDNNSNGNLILQNGVFVPINSSIANFIQKDLLVISPLFPSFTSNSTTFTFKLDAQQIYQYANIIQTLEADFGDGIWRNLIVNTVVQPAVSVNINTTGVQNQTINFRATFTSDVQKTTSASILLAQKIPDISLASKSGVCGMSGLLKHRSTIADNTGVAGEIEYRIFYGNQNNSCSTKKPIIIVDGFDPGDKRRITYADCFNDARCKYADMNIDNYFPLTSLVVYKDENGNKKSLIDDLNVQNFDVILVNLPYYRKIQNNPMSPLICGGADDIIRNALTTASFIQKINNDLQVAGSTEKLIVVGPSMGGLVTRYALSYLEKQGINHNTKLWVSMDSPHKGANIPLSVQADIWFFAKKLKQQGADKQFNELLHSKAAEQMLIDIMSPDGVPAKNQNNVSFLNELNNNGVAGSSGFPVSFGIKKIAISNGSLSGMKNVQPKQNLLDIAASAKIRLLGIRIGRKRIFRVNNYYMPNYGDSTPLIQNQGRNPDAGINNSVYNINITSGWDINGSMDAVPGGNTNSANDVKNEINASLEGTNAFTFPISLGNWFIFPILTTDKNLIIDRMIPSDASTVLTPQAFIPTHSSFSTSGFSDWYQPINKNIVCSGQTPFDSYYGEQNNMEHVTFSNNMVTWLRNNFLNGLQPPSFPVDITAFQGPDKICISQPTTYSFTDICKIPGNPSWSVTPNLQIVNSNAGALYVNGLDNGSGIITATFQNGQTVTKKIWIGKPLIYMEQNFNNFPRRVSVTLKSMVPDVTLQEQGIDPASIVWHRPGTNFTKNGGLTYTFMGSLIPPLDGYPIEVTATNICGATTELGYFEPDSANCGYNIAKTTGNTYNIVDPCPIGPITGQYSAMSATTSSSNPKLQNLTTKIYNSMGSQVLTTNNLQFTLDGLMTGTYYAKIFQNGNLVHTQIFIKN